MTEKTHKLAWVAAAVILAGCSLPQVGIGPTQSSSSGPLPAGSTASPTVVNDSSRSQAVFVTESGQKLDIVAPSLSNGSPVRCINATGYSITGKIHVPDPLPAKAIIVGKRSDGKPGVWEIGKHGHVRLPWNEQGDEYGDLSPHHGEGPEGLHSWLGWTYNPTTVTGNIIVGYAINEKGFSHGSISIPPGTQVAVYWRLYTLKHSDHIIVSPPQIIGTWQAPSNKHLGWLHGFLHHDRFGFLNALKLFFFNKLQSYLVSTSEVSYDSGSDSYIVKGVDQDGDAAEATIAPGGSITIEKSAPPPPPPATTYSRLIIETFDPTGPGFNPDFDILTLYGDPTAAPLASGENNNPSSNQTGYAYIDYQTSPSTPFTSGTTLYVRVTGSSATVTGPYGIRVLTAPSSTYPVLGVSATTANEPDNTPTDTGVATLQPGGSLSSYLSPGGDVDWIKITLP